MVAKGPPLIAINKKPTARDTVWEGGRDWINREHTGVLTEVQRLDLRRQMLDTCKIIHDIYSHHNFKYNPRLNITFSLDGFQMLDFSSPGAKLLGPVK